MSENHAESLQVILNEFKNFSPEISRAIIYNKNGETVATNGAANNAESQTLLANVDSIVQQAEKLDEVENLTIQAGNGQLDVAVMDTLCLAAVSTRSADPKIVKSLTHVVVPTVVELLEKTVGYSPKQLSSNVETQIKENQDTVTGETVQKSAVRENPKPLRPEEPGFPSPSSHQLMVEKIAGFLVATDTVRIDSQIVLKWINLYEGKHVTNVKIETLDGKTVTCKFKAARDAASKGIIQIPERILQALQANKGSLVIVKPVVE